MKSFANCPPVITEKTLDKLSENCPKLLRVFRPTKYPKTAKGRQIYARRMNADSKLRKVHRIVNILFHSKQSRFDYDSVESCSDEDCAEH
jgi:hypothetical protein